MITVGTTSHGHVVAVGTAMAAMGTAMTMWLQWVRPAIVFAGGI